MPLRSGEVGPSQGAVTEKAASRRVSKDAEDVEAASSGSEGGEVVDRSLPSLFSPAARAKSVMDVSTFLVCAYGAA